MTDGTPNLRRIMRVQRLLAELGLSDVLEALEELKQLRTAPAEGEKCWCLACNGNTVRTMMTLCPDCGNKRCPHASNHCYACTNSNEPGQDGSVY